MRIKRNRLILIRWYVPKRTKYIVTAHDVRWLLQHHESERTTRTRYGIELWLYVKLQPGVETKKRESNRESNKDIYCYRI